MKIELTITPRRFAIVQFTIIACLLILAALSYVAGYVTGYHSMFGFLQFFDVAREESLPTFFAILNLLVASLLALAIYRHEKATGGMKTRAWLLLAIVLLGLAIDESCGIHERFIRVQQLLERHELIPPWFAALGWMPYGAVAVVVLVAVFTPWLMSLPGPTKLRVILAGTLFVAGALGFELAVEYVPGGGYQAPGTSVPARLCHLCEEGLEFAGVALFNCALYREIAMRKLSVTVSPGQAEG